MCSSDSCQYGTILRPRDMMKCDLLSFIPLYNHKSKKNRVVNALVLVSYKGMFQQFVSIGDKRKKGFQNNCYLLWLLHGILCKSWYLARRLRRRGKLKDDSKTKLAGDAAHVSDIWPSWTKEKNKKKSLRGRLRAFSMREPQRDHWRLIRMHQQEGSDSGT